MNNQRISYKEKINDKLLTIPQPRQGLPPFKNKHPLINLRNNNLLVKKIVKLFLASKINTTTIFLRRQANNIMHITGNVQPHNNNKNSCSLAKMIVKRSQIKVLKDVVFKQNVKIIQNINIHFFLKIDNLQTLNKEKGDKWALLQTFKN